MVNLTSTVHRLLQSNGGTWTGTAKSLCQELGLGILPRVLSVWLRNGELDGVVHVTFKKKRGVHLISLSLAPITTPERSEDRSPEDLSGCSKIIALSETAVSFPFCWTYSVIAELDGDERQALARRSCSLCGVRGCITHSKRCEGYPRTLLCRSCAENYAGKALRLMQSWPVH